jgi:hypothetical protein
MRTVCYEDGYSHFQCPADCVKRLFGCRRQSLIPSISDRRSGRRWENSSTRLEPASGEKRIFNRPIPLCRYNRRVVAIFLTPTMRRCSFETKTGSRYWPHSRHWRLLVTADRAYTDPSESRDERAARSSKVSFPREPAHAKTSPVPSQSDYDSKTHGMFAVKLTSYINE